MNGGAFLPTSSPALATSAEWVGHPGSAVGSQRGLGLHFSNDGGVEHVFVCFLVLSVSLEKFPCRFLLHDVASCFVFDD
jgi:hypothetical protein